MKNISILVASLVMAGSVYAAPVPLASSGPVTMANCSLLNEDVRLNLTTGVVAGVDCSPTIIAISACHTAGKQTSRTVNLRTVEVVDSRGETVERKESCSLTDSSGNATPGCATVNVAGPAMPTATTIAGTVVTQYPGGNICNAGAAATNATNNL